MDTRGRLSFHLGIATRETAQEVCAVLPACDSQHRNQGKACRPQVSSANSWERPFD
jgi:hypothetical protein